MAHSLIQSKGTHWTQVILVTAPTFKIWEKCSQEETEPQPCWKTVSKWVGKLASHSHHNIRKLSTDNPPTSHWTCSIKTIFSESSSKENCWQRIGLISHSNWDVVYKRDTQRCRLCLNVISFKCSELEPWDAFDSYSTFLAFTVNVLIKDINYLGIHYFHISNENKLTFTKKRAKRMDSLKFHEICKSQLPT